MASKKQEKESSITCEVCECSLQKDHTNVKCIQGHHLCQECSIPYIAGVFEKGPSGIPPICAFCPSEIPRPIFEMQLSDSQRQMYLVYVAAIELQAGEEIASCPFCKYFEIWSTHSSMSFFDCKLMVECGKKSCYHCKLEVPETDENGEFENEDDCEILMSHFVHTELAAEKKAADAIIRTSMGMACPDVACQGCEIPVVKDDACTHMTCPVCSVKWCYFCGEMEGKLDVPTKAELDERGAEVNMCID